MWQHKPVPPGLHALQCMITKTSVICDDVCCDAFRHFFFFAKKKKTEKQNQNNLVKLIERYSD